MKIYQVAPGLWQGALKFVSEDWSQVREHIDVAVLMATPVEPIPQGENDPPLLVFPIDDNPNGCDELTWNRVVALSRALAGGRTLCICHMGENRSGLLAALILMARGLSAEAAIALLRERVRPNSGQPHVLWNPGFERQVRAHGHP